MIPNRRDVSCTFWIMPSDLTIPNHKRRVIARISCDCIMIEWKDNAIHNVKREIMLFLFPWHTGMSRYMVGLLLWNTTRNWENKTKGSPHSQFPTILKEFLFLNTLEFLTPFQHLFIFLSLFSCYIIHLLHLSLVSFLFLSLSKHQLDIGLL